MYLKEIGIKGFKSFAYNVKLNIPSGITVIVGPNGCGKSNIIDAVRWILGEQNIRSLRGTKITDMIFSGNQEQRVKNFAQVYMLFDNADRKFSINSEEVEIKRIIYRSGEIENYINGNLCKLKDIQEFFLGSGLGKNSYSIIAQGKVDFVLNAKALERRILFEEASDVAIYRNKKENALKKLEITDNNLIRINDILYQVEETLSHYKKKSEDLEIYKSYQDQIQKLEYYLFNHQYKLLQNNINRNNKKLDIFKNDILRIEETLAHHKNNIQHIEQKKEQLETQLEKDLKEFQAMEINKNIISNKLALNRQKKSEIVHFTQKIKEDMEHAHNQYQKFIDNLADIDNDIKETYQKEVSLKDNLEKVVRLLEKYSKIHNYYQKQLLIAENSLKDFRTSFGYYQEEKIKKETELKSSKFSLSEIEKEINYLSERVINNQKLLKSIGLELSVLENNIIQLSKEEREKKRELSEKQILINKENNTIQNYFNELTLKTKEVNLLEDLIKLNQDISVKNNPIFMKEDLLKNSISGHDLKKSIIEIPEILKQILDYIFEDGIQYVHVPYGDKIPFLRELLTKEHTPKIEIIADNLIINNNNLKSIKKEPEFEDKILGFIPQLISFPSEYKSLVEALFGHILIVKDVPTALLVAQQRRGQWTIISLDGIVINEKGIVIIDSSLNATRRDKYEISPKRILELKQEIQFINRDLQRKQLFLESEKENQKELQSEIENIEKQLNSTTHKITEKKIDLIEINNIIRDSTYLLKSLESKKNAEMEKIDNIEEEIIILNKNITDYQNYLVSITLYTNCLAKYGSYCRYLIDEIKKDIDNYNIELSWSKERRVLLEKRKKEMEYFITSFHQEKKERENKLEQYSLEYRQLGEQETELKENLNSTVRKLNILDNGIKKLRENLKEQEKMLKKLREKADMEQEELGKKHDELNECKMVDIQNQEKINHLLQTLNSQYNTSLDKILCYKNYAHSSTEAVEKITQYKEQIKQMGQINFSAAQEYQEQLAKYREIYNKKEEIVQSKEKLLALIKQIDQIAEEHFLKTFQKIQIYFNDIFKKLFQGGEISLELTNIQRPLEAGIEVMVQPPGKRITNISLLSTGEKALTAIALLFALWKANPTPFCFFDEIDSALDETNAIRLASFLKNDELKNSQIIIITHQKKVMQAADALYGITMDEYGVSKLMSVKMID